MVVFSLQGDIIILFSKCHSRIIRKNPDIIMTKKKKLYYWIPTIGYMALIFTLSSFSLNMNVLKTGFDKVVHMFEYACLAWLFYYSLIRTTRYTYFRIGLLATAFTVLYGISDEIHQLFVPGRTFDIMDMVFDALGALTVYLARFRKKVKSV